MRYWRGLIACGSIALSVTGCWGEKSPDEIRAALEKGVVLIICGDKGGYGTVRPQPPVQKVGLGGI
jgi:hypothetical protein